MELTILILTLNEEENLRLLLPEIKSEVELLGVSYEFLIVDGKSKDKTREVAEHFGCRVVEQTLPNYGSAMKEGIINSKGEFIVVLDADYSHPAALIQSMWNKRSEADIVIASRYVKGGKSSAPFLRQVLSRCLNYVYSKSLVLPVKDLSSGFRLYRKSVLMPELYVCCDFDILLEILVRAYCAGSRIKEVPLEYQMRKSGKSNARVWHLVIYYVSTLIKLGIIRSASQYGKYLSAKALNK